MSETDAEANAFREDESVLMAAARIPAISSPDTPGGIPSIMNLGMIGSKVLERMFLVRKNFSDQIF